MTALAILRNPLALAAISVAAVALWAVLIHGPGQFRAGEANERQMAAERAQALIQQMEADNAALKKLSVRDLCIELAGGVSDGCPD